MSPLPLGHLSSFYCFFIWNGMIQMGLVFKGLCAHTLKDLPECHTTEAAVCRHLEIHCSRDSTGVPSNTLGLWVPSQKPFGKILYLLQHTFTISCSVYAFVFFTELRASVICGRTLSSMCWTLWLVSSNYRRKITLHFSTWRLWYISFKTIFNSTPEC